MKICDKEKTTGRPPLIGGHIYVFKSTGPYSQQPYLYYSIGNTLVNMRSGLSWSCDDGFGGGDEVWEDVTDKYCLKRIEE